MPLDNEQRKNAAVIIRVGQQVGASSRDLLVALMTALQESGLRNLNYGDRDSLGLFQQRPSMAWGSRQQITNPEYAARAFFLGAGTNKGLLDYSNRNSMSLTQAAQTVQRSAFPDAYAKHESSARKLLDSLGDGQAVEGTLGEVPGFELDQPSLSEALADTLGDHPSNQEVDTSSPLAEPTNDALGEATHSALGTTANPALDTQLFDKTATQGNLATDMMLPNVQEFEGFEKVKVNSDLGGWRGDVVQMANKFLGTPYVWGGAGPSGFDCSGLLQYIFNKAGISLPRVSADQARAGKRISLKEMKPGDLVAWDNSSRNNGADHIAVYIGNGRIIHAPRPGASVEVSDIFDRGRAWGVRIGN